MCKKILVLELVDNFCFKSFMWKATCLIIATRASSKSSFCFSNLTLVTALTSFPYKPLISSSVKSSLPIEVIVFAGLDDGASAITFTAKNSSESPNIILQMLVTSTLLIG